MPARPFAMALLTLSLLPFMAAASQSPPVDTTQLATGPHATMDMLYERTIFQVDVLRLDLRFGEATADRIESLAGRLSGDALIDSIAAAALQADNVLVKTEFLRDISLDRFLEALRTNLRNARDAGLLSEAEMQTVVNSVEQEYGVLDGRGLRDGDTMWYRVRGDSLHVVLRSADGEILVEDSPVGEERRRAVLGGYFAPGSDYRHELAISAVEGSI